MLQRFDESGSFRSVHVMNETRYAFSRGSRKLCLCLGADTCVFHHVMLYRVVDAVSGAMQKYDEFF
jgi:hypothetical protein